MPVSLVSQDSACFVTGSCQRLALLRECPPACGLPLDFASQSKSLAGSCWLGLGEKPVWLAFVRFVLFVLFVLFGVALPAKSAASAYGVCASSYYFHSECFHHRYKAWTVPVERHPVSSADGGMPSGRFQVCPVRARSACTHQQPVTKCERRSKPAKHMYPSATSDELEKAKQANPAHAPIRISNQSSVQS